MSAYELKTPNFEGPIEKLLSLIEEKELDITFLSLSQVTGDFLAYVGKLEFLPPALLADFILVASKLLLIKSKALLPNAPLEPEEESEIHDLEARLKIYREFKNAGRQLDKLWQLYRVEFGRELLQNYEGFIFYPPLKLNVGMLVRALEMLVKTIQKLELREKSLARSAIISIEQMMKKLVSRLTSGKLSKFSELTGSKDEMIALFLAVLHLFKDRAIKLEQKDVFSDIIISAQEWGNQNV